MMMKGKFLIAAAIGLLVVTPASARGEVFATWSECMSAGAEWDHWHQWTYTCEQADGGWVVVWTNTKKKGRN
jgi:hypothetical protein